MKNILQGWNFMRLLRLGLGIAVLVQGVVTSDTVTFLLGSFFAGLALANQGCCGSNGCEIKRPLTLEPGKEPEAVDNK